ncbi:unnamed protein product [Onchocerca ochengi]|uniref:Secreted protein n=1 Tax=Onchocerca ochengi TaxID=42157 RepID=A0A182EPL5_ONCOC|nr:unnamed protein product [Onchocerca ochengi]
MMIWWIFDIAMVIISSTVSVLDLTIYSDTLLSFITAAVIDGTDCLTPSAADSVTFSILTVRRPKLSSNFFARYLILLFV